MAMPFGTLKALMDTIFGRKNFRNEIVWAYTGPGSPKIRQFNRKHDIILWYSKGEKWTFNADDVRIPYKDGKPHTGGFKHVSGTKAGTNMDAETAASYTKGKVPEDWWEGIAIASRGKQNVGYPTQKPLALYERIIKASSDPGDIVLDPFAGCATTCVAAERLSRQWVGADYWGGTAGLVIQRLQQYLPAPLQTGDWVTAITHSTTPPERTDEAEDAPTFRTPTGKRRMARWTRDEMKAMLIAKWGFRCWACAFGWKDKDYYHLDHINPDSGGGSNELHNRALICGPCNLKKGNTLTLIGLRNQRGYGAKNPHPMDLKSASAWAYEQERLHDTQASARAG